MLDCELEVSNNDNVVNCSMEGFKRLCQPLLILQKKAGVSFKTVSRVLNEEVNVRPATRQKVLGRSKSS
jgi:hypothetical protein